MKPRWRIGLEEELQDQLRLPGSAGADVISDGRCADPKVCIREVAIGIREVGVVENVEELAAKLDGEPFVNRGGFCERGVPLGETGATASIAAYITVLATRRGRECSRINLPVGRVAGSVGVRQRNRLAR